MYEEKIKEIEAAFKEKNEYRQQLLNALTESKEELLMLQGEHRLLLKLKDEEKEKEQNKREDKNDGKKVGKDPKH
jgi:hypothetical protein